MIRRAGSSGVKAAKRSHKTIPEMGIEFLSPEALDKLASNPALKIEV